VARYKWHADYFDFPTTTRASASRILQADNANHAERIAMTAIGAFARVEVRRMGTAAPIRIIYASEKQGVAFTPMALALPIAS
jgi:hypothetical protein